MSEGLIPRGARAAVFAAACVMLSAGTHAILTRGATPLWAVLLGLVAAYSVALAGTGRERSLGSICGLAIAVQLSLDVWFSLSQVGNSIVRECGLIQALPPMGDSITCVRQSVPTTGPLHVSVILLAAQLIVAVLSAWPLHQGEKAQYILLQWLSARGFDLWAAIAVAFAAPLRRRFESAAPSRPAGLSPPRRLLLRFEVTRRGPPALLRPAAALSPGAAVL